MPEALESADIRHETVEGAEPEAMPEVEVFAEAIATRYQRGATGQNRERHNDAGLPL